MIKVIKRDKSYSWLQWRVILPGLYGPSAMENPHVTAKFFGNAKISAEGVQQVLSAYPLYNVTPSSINLMEWVPQKFQDSHVLELIHYPKRMQLIHDAFPVIEDQFTPWRPHITVPKPYWEFIKATGATPQAELLVFGELELYLGTGL